MKKVSSFIAWFLVFLPLGFASEKQDRMARPLPKNMEKMTQWVGNWEGTHRTEKGEEKVSLSYELSSGKSALVEKIFSGSPQEMLTVYTADGQDVVMTHYCMLGNQPRMRLTKAEGKVFQFDFVDATNMKPNESHMHALKITMLDPNHLTQEWTFFENGKAKNTEIFRYIRK